MRSLVNVLLMSALVIAAISCQGTKDPWAKHVGQDVLAKADLQYYWRMDLGLPSGETLQRMYKLDENIYCLTNLNRMICLDAARGIQRWSLDIADKHQTVFPPCHAERASLGYKVSGIAEILEPDTISERLTFKPVLINTADRLLVIDRDTGAVVRDINLSFTASTGPASDGTYAWIGSTKGWYYTMLLQEGIAAYSMSAGGMLTVPPVTFNKNVYVGGSDGRVYASAVGKAPKSLWKQTIGGHVNAPLVVNDKGCFVPCDDNRLYAFHPASGLSMWKMPFICGTPLRQPPQVGQKTVFQYAQGDQFYAINLTNGLVRWSSPSAIAVLGVVDSDIYLLGQDNNLHVADEILGTVKLTLPLAGFDRYVANITSSAIYVGNGSGRVACIRPLSAGYLKPEDLPKAMTGR